MSDNQNITPLEMLKQLEDTLSRLEKATEEKASKVANLRESARRSIKKIDDLIANLNGDNQ